MTSFEVIAQLKTLAPDPLTAVEYDHVENGTLVPFMVIDYDETGNTAADNMILARGFLFTCVLYLAKRDKKIEGAVEKKLNDNELPWQKTVEWIEDPDVYAITYTFGTVGAE